MDLLGLALSLAFPLSEGKFTGDWQFDVNPTFAIPAPTSKWGAAATVVPGAVLYDPRYAGTEDDIFSNPYLMRHEMAHVEQQAALGPGFWAAYGATGGRAFEPYDPLYRLIPGQEYDGDRWNDMRGVWMPEPEQRNQYPLFRVSREDDATRLSLLPGYPQLVNR